MARLRLRLRQLKDGRGQAHGHSLGGQVLQVEGQPERSCGAGGPLQPPVMRRYKRRGLRMARGRAAHLNRARQRQRHLLLLLNHRRRHADGGVACGNVRSPARRRAAAADDAVAPGRCGNGRDHARRGGRPGAHPLQGQHVDARTAAPEGAGASGVQGGNKPAGASCTWPQPRPCRRSLQATRQHGCSTAGCWLLPVCWALGLCCEAAMCACRRFGLYLELLLLNCVLEIKTARGRNSPPPSCVGPRCDDEPLASQVSRPPAPVLPESA
jgi:hypothetical protein